VVGNSRAMVEKNRVLFYAIMAEKTRVEDSRGRAISVILEWMKLNGGNITTNAGIHQILREFPGTVELLINGKRTECIELVEVPAQFKKAVDVWRPRIIWEATPQQSQEKLEAPKSAIEEVAEPPQLDTTEDITPESIATALLEKVVQIINAGPANDDSKAAWRHALEQQRTNEGIQRAYERVREDLSILQKQFDAAQQRIRTLQADKLALEGNLSAVIRKAGVEVSTEISEGIFRAVGGAPTSPKGD